ncbi:helix-turn-helix domain-containing protein [Bacillus swezeyi]|uniref:winged helix-turn-helix transcriptional regulator n=1 Tax=Bacillus swezeyi TaxID=1925020 RepID=UPI003B2F9689
MGNVNTKGLTDTLRQLEENGMISRQVFPTVPVTLTEKGEAFRGVFKEMARWEEEWLS